MEDKIINSNFASTNQRVQALEKSSAHFSEQLATLDHRVTDIEKYIQKLITFFADLQNKINPK